MIALLIGVAAAACPDPESPPLTTIEEGGTIPPNGAVLVHGPALLEGAWALDPTFEASLVDEETGQEVGTWTEPLPEPEAGNLVVRPALDLLPDHPYALHLQGAAGAFDPVSLRTGAERDDAPPPPPEVLGTWNERGEDEGGAWRSLVIEPAAQADTAWIRYELTTDPALGWTTTRLYPMRQLSLAWGGCHVDDAGRWDAEAVWIRATAYDAAGNASEPVLLDPADLAVRTGACDGAASWPSPLAALLGLALACTRRQRTPISPSPPWPPASARPPAPPCTRSRRR